MGYGVQVQAVNYGDPNYWMEMAKGMRVNWIKHQILWYYSLGRSGVKKTGHTMMQ